MEWDSEHSALSPQNPFRSLTPRGQYWAYADYKDVADFNPEPEIESEFRWEHLAVGCEHEGKVGLMDSTLWIGSTGAHSALHFDSYGINIVLQVTRRTGYTI